MFISTKSVSVGDLSIKIVELFIEVLRCLEYYYISIIPKIIKNKYKSEVKAMKKSINAWAFPPKMSFEEVFSLAKKYGFEAIELNVDAVGANNHSFNFDTTEAELKEVKALSEKYAIPVLSVSTGLYWSSGAFASENKEKRDEALKVIRTQLRCASAIGAEGILVVTCVDGEIGLKKSFENTIEVFRSLKDEIAASGVKVGLENVWNEFFSSPMDVKYVLDGIGDENVGIYFDIGNMIEFSNAEWWIDIIGEYIKKVHIKDFKRADGRCHNGGTFCDLLDGDVNFKLAMPKLAKYYDGTITAELFPDEDADMDAFLTKTSKALDEIRAMC